MFRFLFSESPTLTNLGLLVLRIGIGTLFVAHGLSKLQAGPEQWVVIGSSMTLFGINFLPVVWGLLAAITEFFGGMSLALGFATRIWTGLMSIIMIVAASLHYSRKDPFTIYSHPLSLLVVFISLAIAGSGRHSVDHYLKTPD